MFRRVLVALDGSAAAKRALDAAVELAADQRALLIAVHVIDELGGGLPARTAAVKHSWDVYIEALRGKGRRILADAAALARKRAVMYETVMTDTGGKSVADSILAQARLVKADVIVMGTHGRRGLRRMLLGSDAESVLREARLPVLVVRDHEPKKRGRARKRPAERPVKRAARKLAPALRIESSQ
jgi:nucleotide-binding universal stress UspA family protein